MLSDGLYITIVKNNKLILAIFKNCLSRKWFAGKHHLL